MGNITLAIDKDVLESARLFAKDKGTTLNALVREHLSKLIEDDKRREDARLRLIDLAKKSKADMGTGFKFNRDEMYEGSVLSGHQHSTLRSGGTTKRTGKT
jgi:hypothetical protein